MTRRLLFIADVDPDDEADVERWCDMVEAAVAAAQVERNGETGDTGPDA